MKLRFLTLCLILGMFTLGEQAQAQRQPAEHGHTAKEKDTKSAATAEKEPPRLTKAQAKSVADNLKSLYCVAVEKAREYARNHNKPAVLEYCGEGICPNLSNKKMVVECSWAIESHIGQDVPFLKTALNVLKAAIYVGCNRWTCGWDKGLRNSCLLTGCVLDASIVKNCAEKNGTSCDEWRRPRPPGV